MNYENKKVLVVGMARSGIAAAQLLRAHGADVTVNDSKTEEQLGDALRVLDGLQLERKFGCAADELLEGQEVLVISPGIPRDAEFVRRAESMGIYRASVRWRVPCTHNRTLYGFRSQIYTVRPFRSNRL